MCIISIITPTFNSERFIKQTLDSILSQTFTHWELLITDDCSSDRTLEIVRNYMKNDNRIKLFVLDKNSGPGVARNNSILKSKGDYIAFCDSDDMWEPNKLEIQLKHMQKYKQLFSFTDYKVVDESGKNLGVVRAPKKITFYKMLSNNYVGCLTVMYKKNFTNDLLMPNLKKRQDWVLWLKILKKIKVAYSLKRPLSVYRKRNDSISNNKLSLLKYNWRVYNSCMSYNKFLSFLLMLNFLFHYGYKKMR